METIQATHCNNACPTCCTETVEEINAKTDAQIRVRSLTLANIVTVGMLLAYVLFAANGQDLKIPEIVWAIVLGPYVGAGGAKMLAAFQKGK